MRKLSGAQPRLLTVSKTAVVAIVVFFISVVQHVAPAPARALPALEVGVSTDLTWGIPATDFDRTINTITGAGGRWIRADVNWAGGEAAGKGVLNTGYLEQIDQAITKARAAGLQVLMPFADGVPYWASADPGKYTDATGQHWNKAWKPTSVQDYASFVSRMVTRYSALGVHTFEVWNEPNLARFWPSGVNAAEYKALLAAGHGAIKAADPTATVVMGGLSKNDWGYLGQLYDAGARPYFDVVAVHPYTETDPTVCWNQAGTTKRAVDAFCGLEEVRNVMIARGDEAKSVWLTEFGWSTTTATYGVTEANQATYLTKALDALVTSYPYVRTAIWFNLRNNFWSANDPTDIEANFGLVRTDFVQKPAYAALRNWTAAHPQASATTTTLAPPTTTTTTTAPVATTTTTTTALVMSNIRVTWVGETGATIAWTTNVPATTRVDYGQKSFTATANGPKGVTAHSVTLSNLARGTRHIYRTQSVAPSGAWARSATFSFTTR